MRSNLANSLYSKDEAGLNEFIRWGQLYLEQIPDVQLYADLAVAFDALGRRETAQMMLAEAQSIYPGHKPYVELQARLDSGQPLYAVPRVSSASSSATSQSQ
jgi:hypothetical protein